MLAKKKTYKQNEKDYIDTISEDGVLTFGSRLKRCTDLLFSQVQELYKKNNKNFKPSWFKFLLTIRDGQASNIKTLVKQMNITQPAASQIKKELTTNGLIEDVSADKFILKKDSRYKSFRITTKGVQALESIAPELRIIEDTLNSILGDDIDKVMTKLNYMEHELKSKPFIKRNTSNINFTPFSKEDRPHYELLHREWLEEHDCVREHDLELSRSPEELVLNKGGAIYMINDGSKAVGALTLMHISKKVVEIFGVLLKQEYQGLGIGNLIMNQSLEYAEANGYKELSITSNPTLKLSITPFDKYDFISCPLASNSKPRYNNRQDLKVKLTV